MNVSEMKMIVTGNRRIFVDLNFLIIIFRKILNHKVLKEFYNSIQQKNHNFCDSINNFLVYCSIGRKI